MLRHQQTYLQALMLRHFMAGHGKRLLQVNHWHQLAGVASAVFQLIDSSGEPVSRTVEEGDYFKVDIPGPGSSAGEGYDWVKVEKLVEFEEEERQSIGFRVRPSAKPGQQDQRIAHFYDTSATSSFIVALDGRNLSAHIYDRNLVPNKQSGSITDKIRDTTIGLGAIAGLSKMQWNKLVEGIIEA